MTFKFFLSLLNHVSRNEKVSVLYSCCGQNLIKNVRQEEEESIRRLLRQ